MVQVVSAGGTPHQSSTVSSSDFSGVAIVSSEAGREVAQRELAQQNRQQALSPTSYPKEFAVREDQQHIYTKGVSFTVPVGASVDIRYERELQGGGLGRGQLMPSDPSTISLQYDPVGSVHLSKASGETTYSVGLFKGFKGKITVKVDGQEFVVSSSGEIKDHAPLKAKSETAQPKNVVVDEVKEKPGKGADVKPSDGPNEGAKSVSAPSADAVKVEKEIEKVTDTTKQGARGIKLSSDAPISEQVSAGKSMFSGLNLGGVLRERVGQIAGQLTQGYESLNGNGAKIGDALKGAFAAVSSVEQEHDVKVDVVSTSPSDVVEKKAKTVTELSNTASTLDADKVVEKKVDEDSKQQTSVSEEALRQQAEQERLAELQRTQMALKEARVSFANGIAQEIRSVEEYGSILQRAIELNVPVVMKFGATWCTPCKEFAPTVDEVARQNIGMAKFVTVNVDQSPELVQMYGVSSLPQTTVLGAIPNGQDNRYYKLKSVLGIMPPTDLQSLVDKGISGSALRQ